MDDSFRHLAIAIAVYATLVVFVLAAIATIIRKRNRRNLRQTTKDVNPSSFPYPLRPSKRKELHQTTSDLRGGTR